MVTREYINPIHSCYLNILYYILVNKFINVQNIDIKYDGNHLMVFSSDKDIINDVNDILSIYHDIYLINTISVGVNTYYYEISCIKETNLNDNELISRIKHNKNIMDDIINVII